MATSSDRVLDALRASLKESDRLRQHNQQLTEASWAPIAIVGMGCRFPGGVTNPDELWDLVAAGRDAITEFPDDRGWGTILSGNEGSYVRAGGFVEQTPCFDAGFFGISPREALAMDPQQRMLLEVTWETLEHAGIDPADLRGSKTGVFAGGTHSGYAVGVAGTEGTGGYLLTGSLAAVISGRVAYSLGLEGPAVTVDTACSSSLVAIHLACQSLRSGESSMALAGGVTVLATPDSFADFAQQGGLAPDGRCKAFASAANGIAWSEGAGMFLLERLTDARRNGHPVLAVIRGSAINQDGASNGLTAPNGPSQQRVIRAALSNARLSADDVDAVEAHGTGTTLGDPIEAQALLATYGRDRAPDRPLWLGSVKSNFAHTGAAAGAAGLMKMVQALRHRELPRTLHVDEPTARVDWSAGRIELLTEPRPWHPEAGDAESKARPRRAGVSSFGISGTNAHVIVEEAPPEADPANTGDGPAVAEVSGRRTDPATGGPLPNVLTGSCVALALSARSAGALAGQARRLGARVDGDQSVDLRDVGWSLAATRTVFERRAVVVEGDRAGLLTGLAAVAAGEPAAGVVSGVAAFPGPTVFVFPGQGSQWLGMGRELTGVSPVFAARLAECERALEPHVEWSLGAVLAGEPDAPGLDRVDVVQPALWAVMVSLAAVWQAAGVRPDAVVGHSQGEIAAAVVAGILSLEDGAKVVALRSQALTALSGRGGMASIGAPLEQVEARLTARPGVAVAAVNGPDSTVVSGEPDELRELLGECERDEVRARLLPVDYASHGPQVEDIREQVLSALSGIVPGPVTVPMVSAMTGELLAGPEADADYWYASLRAPVQFDRAVRVLRAGGHGVFVEVSAHPVLTAAIGDTLDDVAGSGEAGGSGAGPVVAGTLRRDDGGAARVLASLAELWVNGVAVDWPGVLVGGCRIELPTYAFEHQRFWPLSLSGGAGDVRSAGLDSIGHPLLGAAVELADGDARVVTGRLSVRAQPWLGEHVVGGFPFFPGTGYVELAVVAGHLVGCTRVEELTLAAPLVLPPDTEIQVQITVGDPGQDGLRELEIYARPQDAGADWVRYASGQIGPCGSPAEQDTTDFAVWPPKDATATEIGGLYEALAAAGQEYGPAFQGLSAVWERGEDIFVEVASPEDADTGAAAFGIHPTVLDATLHAVWMKLLDEGAQMPFVWSEVSLFASGATALRARLRRGPNGAVSLLAVDGAGAPVISVGRLALRPVPSAGPAAADQPVEEALFGVEWIEIPDTDSTTAPVAETGRWVVVGADSLGVVEGLVAGGAEPEVHPDLSVLADAAAPVPGVVLTAVGTGGVARAEDGDQGREARRLTNQVVALLQQWMSLDSLAETRLVVLTRGAVAVRPGDGVADLAAAGAWGLLRSAQTENPGRLLLVDLPTDPGAELVGLLTEALSSPEPELAVRDGRAYGRRLVRPTGLVTEPDSTDASVPAEEPGAGEEPGAVLVTGGTGTLGGLTARHLARTRRARRLLLVSRSGAGAASTGPGPAAVAAAVAEAGADVHVVAADTSDRAAVATLLAGLPAECPLTGVIHTAGIVDDGVVGSLTPERVDAVMRPKTDTAWNLHELTRGHPVEHFVMFSSTAAVFGGGGQGNYAAGNAFLDGLAAHRHAVGLPAVSLAWGAWVAEIGIGRNLSASQLAQVNSGGNFGADEGLAVLDLALTRDEALLVPSRIDVATLRVAASRGQALPPLLHVLSGPIRPVISSAANAAPDTSTLHQQLARAPEPERDRILIQLVRTQAAAVLGHPSPEAIEPGRAFTELGFDSLTAVDLRNRLNQATGLRLPATLVFDYPNPAALSQHIGKQLSGVLDDIVPIPVTPAATSDDPIVIVGMGCRFPGGVNSPDEMWRLLSTGTDAISGFPDNRGWDLSGSYDPASGSPGTATNGGGFVDDAAAFDPGFFRISPREALAMDPQQRLLLEISWEAFEHAGIDPTSLRESRTGVFVGAAASGYSGLGVTGDGTAGHLLTGNIASVISGRVSYTLGLEGPAVTVDTACSSSLVAMHLAASALRAGECSLALAGGVMLMIDQGGFLSFAQQGALAADGRSKPFSVDADGMGLAEGAGVVVLERLSDARRNGHPVLAVVRGSAVNQDGASNGLTAPNGPSQQRVIRAALASAGLAAADVDVVEAHGTGTALGDPIEAQAVLATYGRDRPADQPLWLGSVKSNLGHTQHAAGLAGVMKIVLALRHQELPVTLHAAEPSTHVDWTMGDVRLLVEPVPWPAGDRPRRAGISSFGISGTNAHLIVEEPPPAPALTPPAPSTPSVFGQSPEGAESPRSTTAWLVSAQTATGVSAQAERLAAHVSANPELEPADVGWSLASTRTTFEHRAVVLGATRDDLLDGLSAVAAGQPATGVVTGVATTLDPTVFVFPGQGSQWAGMGRELVGTSPVFAARLAECEQALDPYVDWSLSDVLAGAEGAPGLDRVDVVQPALWAVMVSLAAVWQAAGVRPDAVVGHSQGEIAAAVVAEILTLDDAAKVVALRSQALTALSGHGGMLSIAEPVDLVEARLASHAGQVAIAAVNGPAATVVSGDLTVLRELLGECERDGVRARLLPVDYASHGPQVEDIREQVLSALSGIVPGPVTVPMVSAMTGEHLAGPEADAEYWYASLRNSVQFDRAIRGLRQGGYGLFVEVSPHPVLTAAVETSLEGMAGTTGEARAGSAPVVVGTLRRGDGGAARMLASLAELHVRGVAVDWPGVLVGGSRIELPTYAFEHQRFWPLSLSGGVGDVRSAGLDSVGHPLLGAAVELADGDARVVTGRLSVRAQPWLGEHVVGGFPFFPGTGYVELAVVAGHLVGCTRVEELTLAAPLVLPPDAEVQVQITVGDPGQDGLRELEIYARPQGVGAEWVRYASGQVGPCGSPAEQDTTDFEVWPPPGAHALAVDGLYTGLAAAGQDFGPAFQGLTAVWQRGEEIFAEVALPQHIETDAAVYGIHPAILDAALQAVWMNGSAETGARMPFAWSDVSLYAAGATRLRARLRRGPAGAASLLAVDGAGAPVISVGSLVLRPVTPPAPDAGHAFRDALFGVEWLPVPDAAPLPAETRWAVVGADSLGLVETLATAGVEPEVYPELSALADSGGPAPGVVFAAVGTGGLAGDSDQGRAARRLTNDVVALLRQWLSLDPLAETRLVVVTRGAVAALQGEAVTDLAAAAAWGLLRSAQTENPGRLVLVDLPAGPPVELAGLLAGALGAAEPELAIRAGRAHRRRLVRPADLAPLAELPHRSGAAGAVLVTGGTGTLGGLTARHLARTGRARRLLLVSRSGPGAASTGAGPAIVAAAVAEAGVDVQVVAADTGDRAAVATLLAGLPAECPLTGVIHTAGIVDDGVVGSLTPEQVDAVMRPKTDTAWVLHELTQSHPVELFVMFSSTAAVFGGGGQGNYAAGNAFLDGLAGYRRAAGLPGLSLAWGAWVAEIGIGRNLSASQLARVNSGGNFGAEEGLAVLDLALTRDEALLVPSRLDVATLRVAASRGQVVPPLLQALSGPVRPAVSAAANAAPDTSAVHQQLARAPESERDRILTQLVRTQAAAVLGHSSPEAIEPGRAFTELGFDSLTAVDLRNRLNQATGLRLPATLVFDYPNPAALSQHIGRQLSGVIDDITPTPHSAATTGDPIVIVGMGCRFPGGVRDPQELWELLAQGRDVITPLPDDRGWDLEALYDPDPDNPGTCYARSGAFLHDSAEFDPDFFGISPREALAMDPQQRLLLETSWEAFERAGIDPTRLRGSQTGVFTGGSSWGYGAFGGDSEGHSMIGTSTSVMSGRVSYTLGLEGPAVTVDTACSSSLVAIHLAASALRAGECTLALAGGVTIMALPGALIGFSRQRGLAKDGRCKAFSASADGMGMGEGAAMILLERLSDARRNGHPVLAVVRGSAVNQDGASNGLTAPNGPSQQRVIRAALASAGLAAADVDVVEAHGTGTALGDPIEAQAVLATYGRDRPADQPLWLGSVKSNLGHTQSAAGAAGVMKMVLALQHQELPVSLHADEPAHNIDWSAGHVELLAEARPWPVNGRPRRAGVSSFGISGTNAHLILEEPPPVGAPSPEGANGAEGRPPVLLDAPQAWLLSGRTASALTAQAGRLVAWVRGRDGVAPADVGWSLATDRSAFEHRAVVLGSDVAELLSGATAVAEGESAATVLTGTVPVGRSARVGFLFAGQGAQRAGMGRQLYTASPVFAAAFDRAAHLLEADLGLPIREVVLGAPDGDPGQVSDQGDDRADQTVFAQTGLFALEVGLVAVLAEAGIVPDVVAGHSVGEIAAAYAAGVLSLEDACALVAARARLMQDLPPGGAMAAVAASEADVLAELDGVPGVSLAAVNGPFSVVVSGDEVAVDELVSRWREQGRRVRRLRVSHAFHSARMDPALPELGTAAAGLEHRMPSASWVGALSGAPVEVPEAGYWTAQARQPVRFADTVKAMAELGVSVFIEIGPDGTLCGMASTALGDPDPDTGESPGDGAELIPLLRPHTSAAASVYAALARAHVHGVSVDWTAVLPAGRRIDLPTYAFTRRRFWIGTGMPAELPNGSRTGTTGEARFWAAVEGGDARALADELAVEDRERLDGVLPMLASWRRREREDSVSADWRYTISWARVPDPVSAVLSGVWLVVVDRAEQAADHVRALTVHGAEPVVVEVAADELDRTSIAARVGQALDGLPAVTGVVSLLALEPEPSERHPMVAVGLAATLGLVQALGDLGVAAPLWVLTRGAVAAVDGEAPTAPMLAQVWGLGRVVGLEHPNRWGGLIDLPEVLDGRAAERLCAVLAGAGQGIEDQVAIRGTGILGRRLVRAAPARGRGARWTPHGTVLVTGGSGALGGHAARWAAGRGADRIAVTSRSGANAPGVARLAADLAETGASVAVLAGDVGARDDVVGLLRWVTDSGPGLTAVLHAAGVAETMLVDQAELAGVAEVMAAKVGGAVWLDQLTAELDLAQFVVFSSISSTWGSGAQPGYAAGNAFLDALIENRRARGLAGASVAWGPWGGAGMAGSEETRSGLSSRGLRFLDGDRGIGALASVVDGGGGVVTVADVDWARFAEVFTLLRPSPLIADLPEVREVFARAEPEGTAQETTALTHQLAGRSQAERDRILTGLVRAEVAAVLGHESVDEVDPLRSFSELGFDSLTAVELRNRLGSASGLRLASTVVFDCPTVSALAQHLLHQLEPGSNRAPDTHRYVLSAESEAGVNGDAVSTLALGALYQRAAGAGRADEAMVLMTGLAAFRPRFSAIDDLDNIPAPVTVSRGPAPVGMVCLPSFFGRSGPQEYARLAGQFQGLRSMSVLSEPGFREDEPLPASLADLVLVQVEALTRSLGDVPVVLLGHSSGGMVAHAVARHLEDIGQVPAGLVLVDTMSPPKNGLTGVDWSGLLDGALEHNSHDVDDTAWLTAMAHYYRFDWQEVGTSTVPTLQVWASDPIPGAMQITTHRSTWAYSRRSTAVEVPGDHFSMLGEHAATTAAAIERWLTQL